MSDALISIRPKHVDSILSGLKLIEIRRRRLRIESGTRLWIYSTLPSGRVEAMATVSSTESGEPEEMWGKVGDVSGTTYEKFMSYCRGRSEIFILWLSDVRRLVEGPDLETIRSHVPGFVPPQSFMWLAPEAPLLKVLSGRLQPRVSQM
jgi:predicted transcriptional regulator